MTTPQEITAKWEVVQIFAEEGYLPTTVNVYAAKIDPKSASALIRQLSVRAPLKSLAHVKRIRRVLREGSVELSIILCISNKDNVADDFDFPVSICDIVKEHNLHPFAAAVPERPAQTREQWDTQCQLWPTSFHPNMGRTEERLHLNQSTTDTMCVFMERAIEKARLARENGQLANGAVIVDPALGTVVAAGYDKSNGWSLTGSHCVRPCSSEADSGTFNVSACAPLRHAIMEAIGMAAERDRQLWPDEHSQANNGDNRVTNSTNFTTNKRLRRADDIHPGCTAESCPTSCDLESSGDAASFEIARPYLCTDWDLYVTREPCAMCAMAMVHQRIRRVIYGISNPHVGALGSQFKLHALPSLNHHYSVFRVGLCEDDLK